MRCRVDKGSFAHEMHSEIGYRSVNDRPNNLEMNEMLTVPDSPIIPLSSPTSSASDTKPLWLCRINLVIMKRTGYPRNERTHGPFAL
jgi:hypothetical protein